VTGSHEWDTSGSDGVGLTICKKMAKQGFNICMVSRNEKKLQGKLEEILAECGSHVKTMYIVADFAQMNTIEDYQSQIADKLENIDVAMLYLNGASCQLGTFEDHT